jgi:hypothetical protein
MSKMHTVRHNGDLYIRASDIVLWLFGSGLADMAKFLAEKLDEAEAVLK